MSGNAIDSESISKPASPAKPTGGGSIPQTTVAVVSSRNGNPCRNSSLVIVPFSRCANLLNRSRTDRFNSYSEATSFVEFSPPSRATCTTLT
jgi:hypothetical protein